MSQTETEEQHMSKQSDNNRKLHNACIRAAAGVVQNTLKKKIKSDRDAWWFVYEIQALHSAVSFTVKGKKAVVHLSYHWFCSFVRTIADKYETEENQLVRLLLVPVFTETDFTDDELTLIEFMDMEYSDESTPVKNIRKDASELPLSIGVGKTLQHLVEKDIVSVEDGRAM